MLDGKIGPQVPALAAGRLLGCLPDGIACGLVLVAEVRPGGSGLGSLNNGLLLRRMLRERLGRWRLGLRLGLLLRLWRGWLGRRRRRGGAGCSCAAHRLK